MFAQQVCRVLLPRNVCEHNESSGNGLTDIVEGEHVVPLVELGMWLGCTIDNGLIVTKDETPVSDGDTQVTECLSEVDNLFNAGACS